MPKLAKTITELRDITDDTAQNWGLSVQDGGGFSPGEQTPRVPLLETLIKKRPGATCPRRKEPETLTGSTVRSAGVDSALEFGGWEAGRQQTPILKAPQPIEGLTW